MGTLEDVKQAVLGMVPEQVEKLVRKALDEGASADQIMNEALIPAMGVVGDEYESGERYVPEMLMSAEAMKSGMEVLRPLLTEQGVKPVASVVMGTVEGDLHDIGLNLVSMMLEGSGFMVVNLGTDVSAADFASAVRAHKPEVLGMSALLSTTMLQMKNVIEMLKDEGLRDRVKIMVGGAPVTQSYAEEVGADGYALDAAAAVKLARRLVKP